jgi:hypothetical protein
MAALRDRYRERGMDVHGFDGDDNLLHVIVYGRITGAEIAVNTIVLDGHMDEEAEPRRRPRTSYTRRSNPGADSGPTAHRSPTSQSSARTTSCQPGPSLVRRRPRARTTRYASV